MKVNRTVLTIQTCMIIFAIKYFPMIWYVLLAIPFCLLKWPVTIGLLSRFFINSMIWRAPYIPIDIAQSYNCMKRSHNGWLADHATRFYLPSPIRNIYLHIYLLLSACALYLSIWLRRVRKCVITADTIITSSSVCDFELEIVKT